MATITTMNVNIMIAIEIIEIILNMVVFMIINEMKIKLNYMINIKLNFNEMNEMIISDDNRDDNIGDYMVNEMDI